MAKFLNIKLSHKLILKNKRFLFCLIILGLGLMYRLILTSSGNFLFNMDNARDLVEVREIVVLNHQRLIGPTSAIAGFYNGPVWYYMLAVPFLLSDGNPFAEVLLMDFLWLNGGFFLLLLVKRFSFWSQLFVLITWTLSNLIILSTLYAFNPNPVIFLTPVFIFFLNRYIQTSKYLYSILTFLVGGLFFQLEMNFGVFILPIIFFSIIMTRGKKMILTKQFIIGVFFFLVTLLPQLIFELKHQFIMSHSVIQFLNNAKSLGERTDPIDRFFITGDKLLGVLGATFFNLKILVNGLILAILVSLTWGFKDRVKLENVAIISAGYILIPFIGYVLLPVTVNSWHLGGIMVAAIVLSAYSLNQLNKFDGIGKILVILVLLGVFWGVSANLTNFFKEWGMPSNDPSVFANELAAVDYVYSYAQGKNFRVYTYLPSVYDYPYQYIFWWEGLRKYGFTPKEYSYLPNKPTYIPGKERLATGFNPNDSGLIFLIKEPTDRRLKDLWENNFKNLKLISTTKVGPLEVEVRKENN